MRWPRLRASAAFASAIAVADKASMARHVFPSLPQRSSARAVISALVHLPPRRPAAYSAIVPSSGSIATDAHAARGSAALAASPASSMRARLRFISWWSPYGPLAPPSTRRRTDVLVDVFRQDIERDVAAEHHRVVERLQIELRPECRLCLVAQPVDLAVPDLVTTCLSRPRAITIHLARHFQGIRPVHVDEEPDALLARPALGVDARVHDQPARAERDRLEVAEPPDVVLIVRAQLVGELLGVERPAFRIRIERQLLTDQRHAVRVFTLPDVARDRLVKRQVREAVLAVEIGRPQIDPEAARDLAVDRAGAAVRGRRAGLLFPGQPLHFHVGVHERV